MFEYKSHLDLLIGNNPVIQKLVNKFALQIGSSNFSMQIDCFLYNRNICKNTGLNLFLSQCYLLFHLKTS